MTPWDVSAGNDGIDYDKLIEQFGCTRIDQALIDRWVVGEDGVVDHVDHVDQGGCCRAYHAAVVLQSAAVLCTCVCSPHINHHHSWSIVGT